MYATVNIQFSEWLVSVMEEKGWSKSEMARRANISPAAISDILSGRRDPGLLVCQGIAKALKVPPEEVLRHAGLIPEGETEKDYRLSKIENLYHSLQLNENKERALQFLEFLSDQEDKDDRTGKKPKRDK